MIDNSQDIIDSRDIIERIEELAEAETSGDLIADAAELAILRELAEEASDYASDWEFGEQLIRDSYFTEYAQELADDLGMTRNAEGQSWPYCHIDWEAAADSLKQDYTAISFDGVTYWVR